MKFIFYILQTFLLSTLIFSNNINPSFNIKEIELDEIFSNDDSIKIEKSSYNDFLNLISDLLPIESILKLVDKNHILPSDFIPNDLINLSDYDLHTRYKEMLFREIALDEFIKMSNSAKTQDIDLFIASTYRSYEFQNRIFNNMKNYHGEEKASTIVAYPGASQHQLGLAVDFGSITPSYAYTEPGKWLLNNGWKFGFTISYPKGMEDITTYMWEPWHYRYIGKSAALLQRRYFNDIQQNLLVFWDKNREFFIEKHKG